MTTPQQPTSDITKDKLREALIASLNEIERLRHTAQTHNDPIAIVGIGLQLPGGIIDLSSLWEMLKSGSDAVGPIPEHRWHAQRSYDPNPDCKGKSYVRDAAFLENIALFDADFFGISPREARHIDPQHRLLLEGTWQALEHAGIVPGTLKQRKTGVFVGIGPSDYETLQAFSQESEAYRILGTHTSFAAGRIAFCLGLHGPAISIDTACSSSLVALHLACQSLRQRECEVALAAGVQVMADEALFILLSRTKALAADGRSKTFSAHADGYGRGEGVIVVALERLSDAKALNRNILAVVRGTAVNHDGASSSITAPNGRSQQAVLRAALENARLNPGDIDVVECHGTGTSLGDPIEVRAIGEVYAPHRTPENPLQLGAIKTNIGHLESAAGLAGVAKMIAAMQYQALPPTLHTTPPNPHIDWSELPVRVTDRLLPWLREPQGRVRRAGVSAFGLSGTNAHVILEEPPQIPLESRNKAVSNVILPFVISAKTRPALSAQARQLYDWLMAEPECALLDVAGSLATGRSHFGQRAVIVTHRRQTLLDALRLLAQGEHADGINVDKPEYAVSDALPLSPDTHPLATRYLRGEDVDWQTVFEPWAFKRQDLPTYPFQRKRYWIETAPLKTQTLAGRYSLSGQQIPLPDGTILHQLDIGPERQRYLADHKVYGKIVVPGAFYVAVLLAVAESHWPTEAIALNDVQFLRPLAFELPSDSLTISLLLTPISDKQAGFSVTLSVQKDSQWIALLTATMNRATAPPPNTTVQLQDSQRTPLFNGRADILARLSAMQVDWGNQWQWLTDAFRVDEQTTLGRFAPPPDTATDDAPVPGGLVDNAFAFSLLARHLASDGVPQLPFAIEHVYWSGHHQRATWAKHALRPQNKPSDDHTLADIAFCNDDGQVLAWFDGITTRRAPAERFFATAPTVELLHLHWQPLAFAASQTPADNIDDVVLFCPAQGTTPPAVAAHQVTTDILRQLQDWLAAPEFANSRFVIVTQGAQALTPDEDIVNINQSPIWGLLRSAQNEHPDRKIRLLDIDDHPASLSAISRALSSDNNQLALRKGKLYRPVLIASEPHAASSFRFDKDGTVLLTGGTGKLGMLIARHLVTEYQCKSLLLLSRQGEAAPGANKLRQDLMQSGAQVVIARCDVADKASLEQAMALIPAEFPLTSVIHLAGTLRDGLVDSMTAQDLTEVLKPKLDAALNLDLLTRDTPLSSFVLFSSMAGLLGTAGQANYAAANAFLDAFAHQRRAAGLPALSLAWGPWNEGMATRVNQIDLSRIQKMGVSLLSLKQGLALFDAALHSPNTDAIPVNLNRQSEEPHPLLAPLLSARKTPARSQQQRVESAERSIQQSLSGLNETHRYQKVLRWVTNEVTQVLEIAPEDAPLPDRPLQELGLDSLMAVEIKNRLSKGSGLRLPVTLLFENPTCQSLAKRLSTAISTAPPSGQKTAAPVRPEKPESTRSEPLIRQTDEQLFARLDDHFRENKGEFHD